MGYKFGNHFDCRNKIIVNDYCQVIGHIGITTLTARKNGGRQYLGAFNAPLFLALAAMTDNRKITTYGEWLVFRCTKTKSIQFWQKNIDKSSQYNAGWCKATKGEIMAKFGEDKAVFPTIAIDITTNSDEKRCYYGSEEQMIALLKSKGYKILKPKTWEEI